MASFEITKDTMIPDLLAKFPQTREVLDRYGLAGCGGRRGPVESLDFFSRTHGVPLSQVLSELRVSAESGPAAAPPPATRLLDVLYRRFFKAAIVIALTLGAGWGAWLLWQIGVQGEFTAISIFDINAHGHAQIYGWIALFVMGFAYQAFGRFRHVDLHRPGWANASFYLMLGGIVVSTVGQILHEQGTAAAGLAVGGRVLELLAISLFVAVLAGTYRKSADKGFTASDGFIFASVGWFVIQALFGVMHLWLTLSAESAERLTFWVATLQAPLRDMQIHGFAMLMVLGVGIRLFPGVFGLPKVSERRAWAVLAVLNLAIAAEAGLFIAYRFTENHALAAGLLVPWLMLLGGVVALLWPWRLWRPMPEPDRSAKFVRAAFGWLVVSMVMLAALPLYGRLVGESFSHAYYGAVRHAITVGFLSMMILGVAGKVVPTLNGLDTSRLTGLWGVFALINLGCAMRCGFQIATDFWGGAFGVVGFSGLLEVTAITLWGIHLWRVMRIGAEDDSPATLRPAPDRIRGDHKVADVLAWFPSAEGVLLAHGFEAIRNPVLRRTLAKRVSLARAAGMHDLDLDALLADLNAAAGLQQAGSVASLPVAMGG